LADLPAVTALVAFVAWRASESGREALPFLAAIALFLLGYLGLLISNFPYIVPPSLTIWQAAAAPATHVFSCSPSRLSRVPMRPSCRRRARHSGITATDQFASKRAFLLAGSACCLQGGCLAVAGGRPPTRRCRHEPNLSRRRACDRVRPGVVQSRPGTLRRKAVQRRAFHRAAKAAHTPSVQLREPHQGRLAIHHQKCSHQT
jgi:hypothetical protein